MIRTKKDKLDFIVIGAQKSGTTTLFEYLNEHPGIAMPKNKEVPFYSRDERFSQGFNWLVENHFAEYSINSHWGKMSPQYLVDPLTPERIHAASPDVKLIVLLRNPVDRAFSQYQMCVRRKLESRTFSQVISQLILPNNLAASRLMRAKASNEPHCYIVWSEYGRLIEKYLQYFHQDQLLILFTSDLRSHPQKLINKITAFLGVDESFTPSTLGEHFHVGNNQPWLPDIKSVRRLAKSMRVNRLIPEHYKGQLNSAYSQVSQKTARTSTKPTIDEKDKETLKEFFNDDREQLMSIVGSNIPW